MTLLFCMLTFTINLWHRIFVTADVTAVCVTNQHGIQRRGQDFEENTHIHSAYTVTRVEELIGENCLHFLPYLLNICRKFELT